MSMAELKKIIIDGKNKFKAYDEADKALQAFESMEQAERDLTKRIEILKKSSDFLLQKNQAAQSGIDDAFKKAEEILDRANKQSAKLIADAKEKIEAEKHNAEKELAVISAESLQKMNIVKQNDERISEQSKELELIASALAKAKEKLKGFMGE